MSNAMFDEFIRPCLKERIAYTKCYTDAFYKHQTCRSVYTFIPAMIDCGVDILNPVQPGVYQMECERLKADFGDRLAFWGGLDTQHLLPGGASRMSGMPRGISSRLWIAAAAIFYLQCIRFSTMSPPGT